MEESGELVDPATPELFGGAVSCAYSSDGGRVTPDDTSSLDGLTTATPCHVNKKRRGRPPLYLTGVPTEEWTDDDRDVHYKVGDFVFFDGRKAGDPLRIGTILALRETKKQRTLASIRLYFKAAQLPEGVYQRLMEDRNGENLGGFGDFLIANPVIKDREVFKSEKSEVVRCHSVRGKCSVIQLTDVKSVRRFVPVPDTYFTLLGYNPDTRRLATIQGEIRIGSGHQAKLPECKPAVVPAARTSRSLSDGIGGGDNGEEQLWIPGRIHMDELEAYVTATRSMVASFTNMSERKTVDEGVATARRDENTQLALNHLHRSDYNKNEAVAEFVKSVPLVKSVDRRWDEEDSKKFMKGLRVYQKNFFKIRKEFLPEKETKELVEYYYYWKKTPISTISNRSGRRSKTRKTGGSTSKPPSSAGDNSSESEEMDSPDSYVCFRCDAESSNQWHYVDQHGFVCESCKLNYRKYGDENGDKIPDYVFRPVEPVSTYRRPSKRKLKDDPEPDDTLLPDGTSDQGRKSPSASSTSSDTSTDKTPRKRKSPSKSKRTSVGVPDITDPIDLAMPVAAIKKEDEEGNDSDSEAPLSEVLEKQKKAAALQQPPLPSQHQEQSSPDSIASELNRGVEPVQDPETEEAGNLGDVDQDDNSTTNSSKSPDLEGSPEPEADTSPALPCNDLVLEYRDVHFMRSLKRNNNSCCRVDLYYVPPPNSEMAKKRADPNHRKKPLAVAQPSIMPPALQPQIAESKIKMEPTSISTAPSSAVSDVIRHTSQSQHPMRATVPPSSTSMQSPHHLTRDQHRMTPAAAHAAQAAQAAMASAHHSSMSHGSHSSNHRVTTPSQRVTPRSQSVANSMSEQMMSGAVGPNTPALLQLSQLAGRQQQIAQQQSIADEIARYAAYQAAASGVPTSMAAAMGLPPGVDSTAVSLHYYRMLRTTLPTDQLDRMYQPEIRDRLDMALKAQDMENHQKMWLAQAAAAAGGTDNKSFMEAQIMEMQRKMQAGMHPGSMMQQMGSMGGLPIGLLPPTSMAGPNPTEHFMRERDRMQKMGLLGPGSMLADPMVPMSERLSAERLTAERLSAAERLNNEQRLSAEQMLAANRANTAHAHTHTHTHLHVHQAEQAAQAAQAAHAAQAAQAAAMAQNPVLANHILQSLGASGDQAAIARLLGGGMPFGPLPPGFPGAHPMGVNVPTSSAGDVPAQLMAAFVAQHSGQEMNPRDLMAMQQMLSNPAAMAAQQEAFHRQILLERERQLSQHMAPQ